MSFITNLFSGGASNVVDSIGNILDNVVTTKEEKMALENEIRKAELQYNIEFRKLDIEEESLFLKDTQSAREKERDIQSNPNATNLGKNISSYLAITATLLCFGMFFTIVFFPKSINDKNNQFKDIVIYILGALTALLSQVYSYYFGSSSGSADKGRTLAHALENKNNTSV